MDIIEKEITMWDLTMYPISSEHLDIILDLIDEYVELVETISEKETL